MLRKKIALVVVVVILHEHERERRFERLSICGKRVKFWKLWKFELRGRGRRFFVASDVRIGIDFNSDCRFNVNFFELV